MISPVLFLIFNRPETTFKVFEAIRAARPPKLYIAADGPRADRPGEAQRCEEARRIAEAVDWPCEIHTLFRDENLGCKHGVSTAVTWFFDHEAEGIILEDDVLPVPTFFAFCDEMLERYRNTDRIAMISGCNLVSNHFPCRESYFFSRYNHIWGWAAWRRSWRHYDVAMTEWPVWRDQKGLATVSGGSRLFETYWRHTLDAAYGGRIDTWDYQWTFACWRAGGLSILPGLNQTKNLGFGTDATHTTGTAPQFVTESQAQRLSFPLTHPHEVARNARADAMIDANVFGITVKAALRLRLSSIPLIRKILFSIKHFISNTAH